MSGLDAYDKAEEQTTTTDSEESVSYIEISSQDYPEAYDLIKGQGPIRGHFRKSDSHSVNELFADLIEALAPFFTEGDKQPMLEWIGPDGEDLAAYAEENLDVELEVVSSNQEP